MALKNEIQHRILSRYFVNFTRNGWQPKHSVEIASLYLCSTKLQKKKKLDEKPRLCKYSRLFARYQGNSEKIPIITVTPESQQKKKKALVSFIFFCRHFGRTRRRFARCLQNNIYAIFDKRRAVYRKIIVATAWLRGATIK